MAVTVVVEDGTGLANANAYADRAFGDIYLERHLYTATNWYVATDATKDAAIVWAAELLDVHLAYEGTRATTTQALGWPRDDATTKDGVEIASNIVPTLMKRANIELARHLIIKDRTAEHPTRGFSMMAAGGGLEVEIDPSDRVGVLPKTITDMLAPIATLATPTPGGIRTIELVRA